MPEVLAICCSDLHLSLNPPIARSCEESWLEAQGRQLDQLKGMQEKYLCSTIICGGDVFDRYNPPPELINFAMKRLPKMYAVPGQHDLPHHIYGDIHRSAYWSMVQHGNIIDLKPGRPIDVGRLTLHGFPWRTKLHPLRTKPHDLCFEIAVIHKYVWKSNCEHAEASEEDHISKQVDTLKGYDIAVFGDNHIPFSAKYENGCRLWNCGGFFRRRSDEINHKPSVGLIRDDGTMERVYLDVSKDKFLESEELKAISVPGMEGFLEELASLGDTEISFREAINRWLEKEKVPPLVWSIIEKALEKRK